MDTCEDCGTDCNITIRTNQGDMSVDMCKMLGTCTCNLEKIAVKTTA